MNNCNKTPIFPYRVVQNLRERNSIPCAERIRGMKVVVVQESTNGGDPAYTEYMLQGTDPCNNGNWKKVTVDKIVLENTVGHATEEIMDEYPITDGFLNLKYPNVLEGFKVTILPLNATFMKISRNRWVITNNILNNG